MTRRTTKRVFGTVVAAGAVIAGLVTVQAVRTGAQPATTLVRGNVAGGKATAGLAQYENGDHFVIFDLPSAQQRYAKFLESLLNEPVPQVF